MVYDRAMKCLMALNRVFQGGTYCVENMSSTADQKIVAALRQLYLRVSADGLVDMLRISESMIPDCRKRYNFAIIKNLKQST